MFLRPSSYDLLVITAIPIALVVQLWTLVIFQRNRSQWRAFDIAIVGVLCECGVRNMAMAAYLVLQQLDGAHRPAVDVCDAFAWTLHSAHTFHASCLASLAVIGVFAVKLSGRETHLRHYLTATHLLYHLFCLTTLCACVGVAAILAKPETYSFTATFDVAARTRSCDLLPAQLDVKYAAFIVILHTLLAAIGLGAMCYASAIYWRRREVLGDGKQQQHAPQHFYDTYTIHRSGNAHFEHAYAWKGDFSQASTTVSSTNSRRPLNAAGGSFATQEGAASTGLATINPVLIVGYAVYHLPVIFLCIFPASISPWPISNVILWLGLLQDVLLPISLGIVDARFNHWVSNVYRCSSSSRRHIEGKLPHMGLDGKFRNFSSSQPQSLEINQMHPLRCYQQPSAHGTATSADHKFPITNGSLYTSIDGRVPIIHNYRRQRPLDARNGERCVYPPLDGARIILPAPLSTAGSIHLNLNLHSANLQRPMMTQPAVAAPQPPAPPQQPRSSTSTATSSGSHSGLLKPYLQHVSLSQSSLRQIPLGDDIQYAQDDEDEDSSSSCFSITTEANGDFEFFRKDGTPTPRRYNNDCRIRRSNSKRSLENLQAYIDEDYFSQMSESACERSISAEFLHDSVRNSSAQQFYVGSVPDFKKVFVSEYL